MVGSLPGRRTVDRSTGHQCCCFSRPLRRIRARHKLCSHVVLATTSSDNGADARQPSEFDIDDEGPWYELNKMELQMECKRRGIRVKGTRTEIIRRLNAFDAGVFDSSDNEGANERESPTFPDGGPMPAKHRVTAIEIREELRRRGVSSVGDKETLYHRLRGALLGTPYVSQGEAEDLDKPEVGCLTCGGSTCILTRGGSQTEAFDALSYSSDMVWRRTTP
jgi:hypothetical protein